MTSTLPVNVDDQGAQLTDGLMDLQGPLRTLLMAAPHIVHAADDNGHLRWLNPAFESISGWSISEWLDRPFLPLFHRDDHEMMRARFARLRAGERVPPQEARLVKRDGGIVVGDFMGVAHVEDGCMRLVLGIMRDVTAKHEMEEALRQSEARYRHLIQRNVAGITLTGSDARFVDVNDAAARMLGFGTREEVIGLSAEDFYDSPEQRRGLMRQLETHGHVAQLEFPLRRRDGSRFWVVGSATRLDDPSRVARVQSAIIDITERKMLEEQLRHSQKMEAIGRLAGGIAHDFNNILMVVAGHCDLLERGADRGIVPRESVISIRDAAERAARLTRQLLSMSRRGAPDARVVDLNDIVRRSRDLLERLIGETVAFELNLADGPVFAAADPSHIEQILMNLVVNARDAMPTGGRIVINTVRGVDPKSTRLDAAQPYIAIEVTDTGVGMSEATRARIFEPFFTTKPRGDGTGLGLAIVYGIVRQHGGDVIVRSEPGVGTTMSVRLPDAEASASAIEPVAAAPAGGTETILIVEDNPDVSTVTELMLQSLGYRVRAANSLPSAIEQLREEPDPVHLLLSDVVMPGARGPEVARAIQAMSPHTRVLYMSGHTDDAVLPDDETSLLLKPFSVTDLARAIRHVLDSPP